MNDNYKNISDELLAAFLDGNVNEKEMRDVISAALEDTEMSEILALSPRIDAEVEARRHSILPMRALAAANADNLCSFKCETYILRQLGHDIDNWSLLETAKANNWVKEEGTPLHHVGKLIELKGIDVRRRYDADVEDINRALNDGKHVIAIINLNSLNHVQDTPLPLYHALYVSSIGDSGDIVCLNLDTHQEETIGKEKFLKAWRCSGNYMVTASQESGGYNPQPIDVEDICLDAGLEELTEAIAENAHDIWARARMDEGWTYGPVRDDARKQNPDLVPYAQLPDSEKEYDRLMAMNTLRLVRRLGFQIHPITH